MPISTPSLLLLILSILAISFAGNRRLFAVADTAFIQKTCKATKYVDVCLSSLKSDPASQSADAKGLALIMIGIGAANSTATSAYLSSQLSKNATAAASGASAAAMKKALKDCADEYGFAAAAFQAATEDLAGDNVDYAYVHITASADYPNVCHNGFRRNAKLAYPPDLARREESLKRVCQIVLGILDNLV